MPPRDDKDEFGNLEVPVMQLKDKNDRRYFVYKNPTEFVEVEADTAREAMDKSGVEKPYKVIHVVKDLGGVLEQSMLMKLEAEAAASAETPPEQEAQATEQPPEK